jgi:hypothetical protein
MMEKTMRRRVVIEVLTVLVVWSLATSGVQTQQQFQVYATIVDGAGASPATLQPADLNVTESGAAAKILKIETVSFPVKLQLLVDNGIGLGSENITYLRTGLRALIDLLPPTVEVTLVATAAQPRFLVRATTDRALIDKGLALLAPDGGAGKFVESLNEATQRIDKDKGDYAPVIVSVATTAGDRNPRDSDVEQIAKRLQTRPTTVHVVLLSVSGLRTTGGSYQTNVGIGVTTMTGGRFENIAAPTRLASLLPEIGAAVAKAHNSQTRMFKITAERPGGASGDLGQVSMGARGGLGVTSLSLDGRVRTN